MDFALLKLTLPKTSEFWGGFAHKASQRLEIRIRILIGNLPILAHHPQTMSELILIFTRNSKCASMKLSEWVTDSDPPKFVL